MKKILIFLIVLALFCPIGLIFAEDSTEKDILEREIRIYQLEIVARQEMIKRLNQEIQVWNAELQKATEKMKEIQKAEEKKEEIKKPKSE